MCIELLTVYKPIIIILLLKNIFLHLIDKLFSLCALPNSLITLLQHLVHSQKRIPLLLLFSIEKAFINIYTESVLSWL